MLKCIWQFNYLKKMCKFVVLSMTNLIVKSNII